MFNKTRLRDAADSSRLLATPEGVRRRSGPALIVSIDITIYTLNTLSIQLLYSLSQIEMVHSDQFNIKHSVQ